tara:strand:+ start:713 stop:2971 length:2259 start_codon:yes stop_codon:yes gene_type:complete
MKHFLKVLTLFLISSVTITAQEITKEDYNRAVGFTYDNLINKQVFNLQTNVNWFKDNSGFWFIDYSKNNKIYKTVSFKSKKVVELFNHQKLAKSLSEKLNKEVKSTDLSLYNIEKVAKKLTFSFKNKTYYLNLESYQLEENTIEKENVKPKNFESLSPNKKWIAFVKEYNLFIKSTETEEEFQLSKNGKKGYEYASWYGWSDMMEGENGERPKHFSVNWSKDSKWIATNIVDTRSAEKMYLLNWAIDSLYKPKLLSYYRGSPGDTSMVKSVPVFFNIDAKKEVKTNLPTQTHINTVSVNWTNDSGKFIATYKERGFFNEYVKQIDLNTNSEEVLIHENDTIGIDAFEFRITENEENIIYLSEKSGWKQLYLFDLKTKESKLLTSDGYYINSIEFINEKKKVIYFLASGKEKENNPYHQQLYKVTFKGKETLLTPENTHHIISFSKDKEYFVDNFSTIEKPTKTVLRETTSGKIITELINAEVSEITKTGWIAPKPFSLIAKDNKTTIYGAFWRPSNFDASKKYPIIDATYTGPHTQHFPKSFNLIYTEQSLAELGFIVVRIDGLGTAGRSKEFKAHSYLNMQNNLEDHVLAIKYLAEKHAFIDVNKVGVYGHSAGGYDTGRAMVGFPDFYKVGVASSGDHDFRMEKAWWPEMYMGWPVDERYHKASNITNAKNLKGKLLLVHGGIDENVNPSATFKFAEALIKADKEFDLLIIPSQRHGYNGAYRNYFTKKRWNYFVEHLLEIKPIWDFNLE